jgi:uncharacterized protein YigE (DUF2233 family)
MEKIIAIQKATYLKDYKIEFLFSDDTIQVVDFETFLKKALHPSTSKYLNKSLFGSFTLDHGDIYWNDYEMCFPIWHLYQGDLFLKEE